MTILDKRTNFKPFVYPWAYDAYKTHEEMHWLPNEATSLPNDIGDYKNRLTHDERSLITQILRFFTQTDIDVANGYTKVYMPKFGHPELTMAMASFAAREAVHIDAYSQVVETLGFGDDEYNKFMEYGEMRDKHEFLWDKPWEMPTSVTENIDGRIKMHIREPDKCIPLSIIVGGRDAGFTNEKIEEVFNLAYSLAKFSGFAEGLQLFSSFAILMSFKKRGLMKGMGDIVTWSVRDESLHVETMAKVFKEIIKDYPWLNTPDFSNLIYKLAEEMVELENKFIDLAYRSDRLIPNVSTNTYSNNAVPISFNPYHCSNKMYEPITLEGLTKEEIKDFVKVTANERLVMLGFKKYFMDVDKNPIPWFNLMVAGEEHANFFEGRGTAYAKGLNVSQLSFDDIDNFNTDMTDPMYDNLDIDE